MPTLLLASVNPGKLHELHSLLDGLGLTLLDPASIGIEQQVEETGDDYVSNACLKASFFATVSGQWTLADDSGLEVDALGGAPGLLSARLAGPGRSDADRRRLLISRLQSSPRPWTARFRCVVALVNPTGDVYTTEGMCQGEIIPEERGKGGFGYDPIFLVQDTGQTMAELSLEKKNRISHRARAVLAMIPILKEKLVLD